MKDGGDKGGTADRERERAAAMIESVRRWAERRDDIRGLVLVGSHARGDAALDSDIDLVLLCTEPALYVRQTRWISTFDEVVRSSREDWGKSNRCACSTETERRSSSASPGSTGQRYRPTAERWMCSAVEAPSCSTETRRSAE